MSETDGKVEPIVQSIYQIVALRWYFQKRPSNLEAELTGSFEEFPIGTMYVSRKGKQKMQALLVRNNESLHLSLA